MTVDKYKFVFLCGLHRSGTSPLFQILRSHPDVSGFRNTNVPEDEGQHLQTVYPAAKDFGGPGVFGFVREARLTENSPLVSQANRERLFEEWSVHWDLQKSCLLEKSPPNLIRTRFLQALFPNSYFVVILRHPIAVSLATSKWTDSRLESLVNHWLHCHRLFEQDRVHLARLHVLKYEELIADTDRELQKIYKFLGVPSQTTVPLDSTGNDSYFAKWCKLSAESSGRRLVRRIVSQYESEVQSYGYNLSDCPSRADIYPAPPNFMKL